MSAWELGASLGHCSCANIEEDQSTNCEESLNLHAVVTTYSIYAAIFRDG